MLSRRLIEERFHDVREAVKELFDCACSNQTHPQDLLLIDQHGFHASTFHLPELQNQGFVIGPGLIGHSDITHYKFIDTYRKRSWNYIETFFNYRKLFQNFEPYTVQLEMLIYLKFWESDYLIKKLYQLKNLCLSQPYDWYYKVPTHPREGSRQQVIRLDIRDNLQDLCPGIYHLMRDTYKTQIRNAIAHSQYYCSSQIIDLLNFNQEDIAHQSRSISFSEWRNLITDTLLLHNELYRAFDLYTNQYKEETLENGNRIEIRITDDQGEAQITDLGIMRNRKTWVWHGNLSEEDFQV